MGLAHSTVSGIAARLERHGLLSRTAQPDDRRYTRLELTEPVRDWLDRDLPAARLGPWWTPCGTRPMRSVRPSSTG
jgi:DNA-binding MarR family transcriptional regulator